MDRDLMVMEVLVALHQLPQAHKPLQQYLPQAEVVQLILREEELVALVELDQMEI